MKNISTNKIDASKRQLIQAINCFFNGGDLISIHTLAAASRQLLNDICKVKKIGRDLEDSTMFKSLDKKTQKELNMAIRKPQNFIKHADKDPDSDITYDGKLTELIIHDACQLYRSLKGKLFHEGAISIMDV